MPENMRRISPGLAMLDMRFYSPLENRIIFIVQGGGRLPHSRTAFIWVGQLIICARRIEVATGVNIKALELVEEKEENNENEDARRAEKGS